MIEIIKKSDCCGCGACESACPTGCISLKSDKTGFWYPSIAKEQCINCGKCERVCPILNNKGKNKNQAVYAGKNKNEGIRMSSSSGGTFYEIAKDVIKDGGVVFGCAMNDRLEAEHIAVGDIKELNRLKSSKYVQSRIGDTYIKAKELLKSGTRVLYSGTPCQIQGFKNYLGRDYENLLLADVLCHGVPSPGMFKDYKELLESRYGARAVSVNFRNKQKGWKRLYIEVVFENGERHYTFSGYDEYLSMFLKNISLRPSCYECRFTSTDRPGDISLGDFWGIGKKYPRYDDDKGISLIMVNSAKGERAVKAVGDRIEMTKREMELAAMGQRTLRTPTEKNELSDVFYESYANEGIEKALEKTVKIPSKPVQLYYAVMRVGLDMLRKILKKGY